MITNTFYGFIDEMEKISSGDMKRVAAIALCKGDKIVLGKRRDNGRWTNPGGHIEAGETPLDGAVRELEEEAGIKAKPEQFKFLKSKIVTKPSGGKIKVYAYKVNVRTNDSTSMKEDPDAEVHRWHWINKNNISNEMWNNMHVPPDDNVLFQALGIGKSLEKSASVTKALTKYDPIFAFKQGSNIKQVLKNSKLLPVKSGVAAGLTSAGLTYLISKYIKKRREDITEKYPLSKRKEGILIPELPVAAAGGSILGFLLAKALGQGKSVGALTLKTLGGGGLAASQAHAALVPTSKEGENFTKKINPKTIAAVSGLVGGVAAGLLKRRQLKNLNLINKMNLHKDKVNLGDLEKNFKNFFKNDEKTRTIVTHHPIFGHEITRGKGKELYKNFLEHKGMLQNPFVTQGMKRDNPGLNYMLDTFKEAKNMVMSAPSSKKVISPKKESLINLMLSMPAKERAKFFHPDIIAHNKTLSSSEKKLMSRIYAKYSKASQGSKISFEQVPSEWRNLKQFLSKEEEKIIKERNNIFKLF